MCHLAWVFPTSSPSMKIHPRNTPLQKEHTPPQLHLFLNTQKLIIQLMFLEAEGILEVWKCSSTQKLCPIYLSITVNDLKMGTVNGQVWVVGWRDGERDPAAKDKSKNCRASQCCCLSPCQAGMNKHRQDDYRGWKTTISYLLTVSPREPSRDWGNKRGPQHGPSTALKLHWKQQI